MIERSYSVWINDYRIGSLEQRGDFSRFRLRQDYIEDPERPVLGLIFENDLNKVHSSALRLPPWFSNLLPEGRLRDWIAADRGVPIDREVELLAQVGRDLPGAVRVLDEGLPVEDDWRDGNFAGVEQEVESNGWKFSLAGVGMKFSMLRSEDRLTLPASGEGGNWIVKLPDPSFSDVPRNEFSMMTLAKHVGIDVPELLLVHRDSLSALPENAWRSNEEMAFVIRRFDRAGNGRRIHIEDMAQVSNIYPYGDRKYEGNYETVASLIYRGWNIDGVKEFVRRLAFNILIGNGDAHLKNWSLIYLNPRIPTLSPAYDIVSTTFYEQSADDSNLALKLGGHKRPEKVSLYRFRRIRERLGLGVDLEGLAQEVVEKTNREWSNVANTLDSNPALQESIDKTIAARSRLFTE